MALSAFPSRPHRIITVYLPGVVATQTWKTQPGRVGIVLAIEDVDGRPTWTRARAWFEGESEEEDFAVESLAEIQSLTGLSPHALAQAMRREVHLALAPASPEC